MKVNFQLQNWQIIHWHKHKRSSFESRFTLPTTMEVTTVVSTTMNGTLSSDAQPFSVTDYVVFSAMLIISLLTGLYHAFVGGGQKTTSKFLLADRSMSSLPIAISIMGSCLSAITLLGMPAEIYTFGVQYWLTSFSFIFTLSLTAIIFIPIYYGLGLVSAYEYLDLRFGMSVRIAGTILFIIHTGFYLAIVLYAPALALEAVTHVSIYVIIVLSGAVCTIYTALGGIKGVIWAAVFQFLVLVVSFVTVVILGAIKAGGMGYIWQYNGEHGHLNFFRFSPDPTVRLTFWGATIGAGIQGMTQWAVSQVAVQRLLSAKSLKSAQRSLWYGIPGTFFMVTLVALSGLVMFAYYNNEDSGRGEPSYTKYDQILIYFVNQEFGHIPGIQGLFIAALYAGTISTVASGLNSLAAVTLVDIVKPCRKWRSKDPEVTNQEEHPEQDYKDTKLSKYLTVLYGVVTLGLTFLATKMGSLVRMTNTVLGALGGPLVGLFSVGMLYKRANTGGAFVGLAAGAVIGVWMSIGSLVNQDAEELMWLYRVSFMWYSAVSCIITFLAGVLVSEIIRLLSETERKKHVDPALLATFLRPKSYALVLQKEHLEMEEQEHDHKKEKYSSRDSDDISKVIEVVDDCE